MNIKLLGVIVGVLVVAIVGFIFVGMREVSAPDQPATVSGSLQTTNSDSETATGTTSETMPTHAIFKTNKGDIDLELFVEQMPITTGNFVKLVQEGFYNGTKFHRVIDSFMIQGGDPNSKGDDKGSYGTGGPGYTIQDEFIAGLSNVRGTISMANTGRPNSGGSQFFINLVDNTGLDFDKPPSGSSHPVFGKVVSGMEVVDAIAKVSKDSRDVPVEPVVISEIELK